MKKKNNPVAKELMTPQYKPRVKESRKTYRRDWELEDDILDEGDFVIDSSGNGNKALLIGDYSITKPSKSTPVSRDSSMEISGMGGNDKAAI